jgi:mannose/cellobiose epimerase-like protein (N-acyl-D-glucosamine 2-epimerase family)
MDGSYWKDQALTDILPYWTKHAVDSVNGAFYCDMDGNWVPEGDTKFPSMIARHLFSYSAAYYMGGRKEDIMIADGIKDYLLKHAWDSLYGGWYDALSPAGDPKQRTKSTFVQVYVITGLALYYAVTHDAEVLDYIDRSNVLLEEKVWDKDMGGYFDLCQQDWTLQTRTKSVSSQLAPLSGYLLYLYIATRDENYLRQAERIMDVILRRMTDTETGWVLESFDGDWQYIPGATGAHEINVGHNIEVAWSLLRLYLLNNREDYLQAGLSLAERLHQYGFDEQNGFWFATIGNQDPSLQSDFTYWWIQAYGIMFDLCLQHVKPDGKYLNSFRKGAAFWDNYFIDKKLGDTHLSVLHDGTPSEVRKANQYKASYHSVEHGLLNYLYLANWINPEPLTLHFRMDAAGNGQLYPLLIEQSKARIKKVVVDGKALRSQAIDSGFVRLSAGKDAAVEVSME